MSPQLKQRIIGGLILVAIIAFATPFLLHHGQPTAQNPVGDTATSQNQPQMELQLPGNSQVASQPVQGTPSTSNASVLAPNMNSQAQSLSPKLSAPESTPVTAPASGPTQAPAPASVPSSQSATGHVVQMPAETTITSSNNSPATSQSVPANQPATSVTDNSASSKMNNDNSEASNTATVETAQAAPVPNSAAPTPAPSVSSPAPQESMPEQQHPTSSPKAHAVSSHSSHRTTTSIKSPVKYSRSAYFLQVGAFASMNRANRIVKKLSARGFHAFIRTETLSNGRTLTRVFVGPEHQAVKVKNLKELLRREFGFKSVTKRNLS